MRPTLFVKLFLGPLLTGSAAAAAVTHPATASEPSPLVPAVALVVMLAASAGTIIWTRRDRRRSTRGEADQPERTIWRIEPESD